MSKRSGLLTKLAENDFSNVLYHKLTELLLHYYEIFDIEYNTNLATIFKGLYMQKNKRSNEIIASKNFISVRTLDRYIKKFNQLALKICKVHKEYFGPLLSEVFLT